MRIQIPNKPSRLEDQEPDDQQRRTGSSRPGTTVMPPPVALVLMNGSTAGSSRVIRGSRVMKKAPMIDPEIVADAADQDHRDELHRHQQVERCRPMKSAG